MPDFRRSRPKSAKPNHKTSVSRRSIVAMLVLPMLDRATRLDREADHALAWGHHQRAETLSRLAAELRESTV